MNCGRSTLMPRWAHKVGIESRDKANNVEDVTRITFFHVAHLALRPSVTFSHQNRFAPTTAAVLPHFYMCSKNSTCDVSGILSKSWSMTLETRVLKFYCCIFFTHLRNISGAAAVKLHTFKFIRKWHENVFDRVHVQNVMLEPPYLWTTLNSWQLTM